MQIDDSSCRSSGYACPSSSLPDVLCDPDDLVWRKGTPLQAIIGRTVFIDGFPQLQAKYQEIRTQLPASSHYHPLDVTAVTLWTKLHLAKNPDRGCWHLYTSLKLFGQQLMAPWTTGHPDIWGPRQERGYNLGLVISTLSQIARGPRFMSRSNKFSL